MTISYVLLQNLRRNPLRTGLTAAAFALPMAVFVAAISMIVAFIQVGEENQKQLRLAVRNKISLTNLLPEGYRRKIEGLDPDGTRIRTVCAMRWFGGQVPGTKNTLQSLGADVDTFPIAYADIEMRPDDVERWIRERRAAVVGPDIARRYNWGVGDRVTLESTVPPYLKLEFIIIKVIRNPDKNYFMFRRDYYNEALQEVGVRNLGVNLFWVKCADSAALRALQPEIDALFANSPDATRSEDENAFMASFTQALGDIPSLLNAMAVVVLFIVAIVAGNNMMLSFRERSRELAVLKAIGLQAGRVFRIVIGESIVVALAGAAIGAALSPLLPWAAAESGVQFGPMGQIRLSPWAFAIALGVSLAIGLLAGLWPALRAMRLRTTDVLRRVA